MAPYYAYFYHVRAPGRNKKGMTDYDARVRMEDDAMLTTTQDSVILDLTQIKEYTRTAKYVMRGLRRYPSRFL